MEMKKKSMLIILLLAALPALLFADESARSEGAYKGTFCSIDDAISAETGSVVLIAIALVIFAIAIAYMVSQFMSLPHLSVWAKDEMVHLGLSVFIAVAIPSLFLVACNATAGYLGGSPFGISYKYLDKLADRDGYGMLTKLTESSLNHQTEATDYFFLGLPITGGKGKAPKADKKALSQEQEMTIDILLPAIVSLKIQKLLLTIIAAYGLSILLPIAILVRVLPFSREAGNFLLALAFGIYVVFPMTFALNAGAAAAIEKGQADGTSLLCPSGAQWCDDGVVNYLKVGSLLPQAVLFPNISVVILIGTVMSITKALNKITAMMA